jgi:putative redox protein
MNEKVITQVSAQVSQELYKTIVSARQHIIIGDEPENAGGKDLGMTPYELLLSSLGECTAITLRMYANRKDWAVDSINVNLSFDDISPDKISTIKRDIEIKGQLTEDQLQRMQQIANACPVHKVLTNTVVIDTSLV